MSLVRQLTRHVARQFESLRVHLRTLFHRRRAERDLVEELEFHLDRETARRVAAGASAEEARRAAARALGGLDLVKEEVRDAWGWRWLAYVLQDVRYATRLLGTNPGFAATAMLTVAIGVGATTAIFSIVYGVMLRPLPYPEPSRLVAIWNRSGPTGQGHMTVTAADHRDWREQNRVFEDIALIRHIANLNLTENGEAERLTATRITANLLPVLGVTPLLGRNFRDDENVIGNEFVALLSYDLWQRRFNGDPGIVGRSIRMSSRSYVVVGVMKPDFHYPSREFEIWVPLTVNPDDYVTRGPHYFLSVARLKPGVTLAQAQADMDAVDGRIAARYGSKTGDRSRVDLVPMLEDTVSDVRLVLSVLLAAVGCVLLIGCANLANLLLARAAHRTRELTVRAALGASRGRLILQSLAELTPILIGGGVLGLLLAIGALRALVPLLPSSMPRVESIGINLPVLAFTAGVLGITGLLCGLVPSLAAARVDLAASMRESSRGASAGAARTRMRRSLVVAQIAIVFPLLVSASLLARSLGELKRVDPGFRTDRVLSLLLAIPRTKYPSDREIAAFEQRLLARVQALPGVESVGGVNRLPFGGSSSIQAGSLAFEGAGRAVETIGDADYRTVTPDYFRTLGIPIAEGRSFTDADTEQAPPVGLIDERVARTVWPDQDPLGKRFRINYPGTPWITIIGVVGHVRHSGLDVEPRPTVYWNYLQRTQDRVALAVRTSGDPRQFIAPVLAALRAIDPEQPAYDVETMSNLIARSLTQRWLNMLLLITFAAVSLTLASIGLYGVMAYAVTQRAREFGVRIALGARPTDVVRLVLTQSATLAATGTTIGLAAAWLTSRTLQSLLYNVAPRDTTSFTLSAAVLAAVALLATYLPARRAARVDPIRTLRTE
jgi:putative ABC transport system permease protein